MGHCYDIKTSLDFFRKLLDEREDFLKSPNSARYAINCAITAWQLHDWVYAEREKYPFMAQFKTKVEFRAYLINQEIDFRTIRDLADGAKHYELTQRKTTILETKTSNWKSIGKLGSQDDTSQLFLKMDVGGVGMTMSFNDLLYMVTCFWHIFFIDNLKEDLSSLFEHYTWF